jgi:hypothetical protein
VVFLAILLCMRQAQWSAKLLNHNSVAGPDLVWRADSAVDAVDGSSPGTRVPKMWAPL